ncbi:unnamed protein product [Sympodiomycopsis kandeliae]
MTDSTGMSNIEGERVDMDESLQFGSPAHSRQTSSEVFANDSNRSQPIPSLDHHLAAAMAQPKSSLAFPKSPIAEEEGGSDQEGEGLQQQRSNDTRTTASFSPSTSTSTTLPSTSIPSNSDTSSTHRNKRRNKLSASSVASSSKQKLPSVSQASSRGHARTKSAPLDDSFTISHDISARSKARRHLNRSSDSVSSSDDDSSGDDSYEDYVHNQHRTVSLSAATSSSHHQQQSLQPTSSPRQPKLSLTSLRNMASSWIPSVPSSQKTSPSNTPRLGASAETSSSVQHAVAADGKEGSNAGHVDENEQAVVAPQTANRALVKRSDVAANRPIRLDRRRLDKAVSLAVEAAQAAEEDERLRKEKERKKRRKAKELRRRQRLQQEAEEAAATLQQQQDNKRLRTLSFDHNSVGGALFARIRTISEYGQSYAYGDASTSSAGTTRHPSPTAGGSNSRFASLPWVNRDANSGAESSRPRLSSLFGSAKNSASATTTTSSADHSETEAGIENQTKPALGLFTDDDATITHRPGQEHQPSSDVAGYQSDEEEEEADDDNFSLSLYLSSLSYLLSALPSKEAGHLPDREKEGLRKKLQEVLRDIGGQDEEAQQQPTIADGSTAMSEEQKEQRLRELLEEELRRAEARMLGKSRSGSNDRRDRQRSNSSADAMDRRVEADLNSVNNPSSTLASKLASTALDVGFSMTALGIGLLGKGIGYLAGVEQQDRGEPSPRTSGARIVGEVPEDEKALAISSKSNERSGNRGKKTTSKRTEPKGEVNATAHGLQWDLAKALASSTASAVYTSLSFAAAEAVREEQARGRAEASQEETTTSLFFSSSEMQAKDPTQTPEDQLLSVTRTLVRSLKRSSLPSQLSHLSTQLVQISKQLNTRYQIKERVVNSLIINSKKSLRFVRRNNWHVFAIRGVWILVEVALEGISVWREQDEDGEEEQEEEEDEEDITIATTTTTTAKTVSQPKTAAQVTSEQGSPTPVPSRTTSWTNILGATRR